MEVGRELDAKVSELMGYTNIEWMDGEPFGCHPDKTDRSYLSSRAKASIPHYSTDIKAAWEVLENIVQRVSRTDWEIGKCEPHGILVYCTFEVWFAVRNEYVFYTERGKSAPHAICLAALKAMAAGM